MKVYVFDLDDTLYEERTYVESGLRAVAEDLAGRLSIDASECFMRLTDELEKNGRGRIFNSVLQSYGIYSMRLVRKCLSVYRGHQPVLDLLPDARRCLERLGGYPVYIVTDGNKHVQTAKLKALGLYDSAAIRKCYVTRRYGVHNEKPSPHCFQLICRREAVDPCDVVYVGDNPHKDFVGIRPLGFRTIRIVRGAHANVRKPDTHEADAEIRSLDELESALYRITGE